MSFNFVIPEFNIGGNGAPSPLQFYRRGFNLGGIVSPTWQDIILRGTTALTLVNAKADSLEYLKLFGGTEQRNLPSGYTQVEYLQSSGTQKIDTSIIIDFSKDFRIKGKVVNISDNTRKIIFSNYTNNASGVVFSLEFASSTQSGLSGNGIRVYCASYTPTTVTYSKSTSALPINTDIDIDFVYTSSTNSFVLTCIAGGQTYTLSDTLGVTGSTTANQSMFLDNRSSSTAIENPLRIKYLSFDDGTQKANYIASKNSSNVLGMYDTVSGNLLTNSGTGTFTAGADVVPTPDNPMDIVCNNGVVKVSPNLFNKNATFIEGYVSNTGVYSKLSGTTNVQRSFCISCMPNTTYTLSNMPGESAWGAFTSNTIGSTATVKAAGNDTLTTGANDKYLIGLVYTTDGRFDYRDTLQIEQGSTATPYMPYGQIYTDGTQEVVTDSVGNTANAERLLAVGDYKDTQEVLSGNLTRNVGVKVLDGTEDWQMGQTFYVDNLVSYAKAAEILPYCTHYKGIRGDAVATDYLNSNSIRFYSTPTINRLNIFAVMSDYADVNAFKQYLADQYNAGTPVIVVYPLATATTETVTGQPMNIQAGTNVVQITQASMDNLELEVKYKAGVEVTITEIENAQLDDNVEVTIN